MPPEVNSMEYVRIPDHAPVLDANVIVALVDLAYFLDTLVERLLGTM